VERSRRGANLPLLIVGWSGKGTIGVAMRRGTRGDAPRAFPSGKTDAAMIMKSRTEAAMHGVSCRGYAGDVKMGDRINRP